MQAQTPGTNRSIFQLCLLMLVSLSICLTACSPINPGNQPGNSQFSWKSANIHWIGETSPQDPSRDLIAVYYQTTPDDLVFRLDFLDLTAGQKTDVQIGLDFLPHNQQNNTQKNWDLNITIPAQETPIITMGGGDSVSPFKPRVFYDFQMDTITIAVNQHVVQEWPGAVQAQVSLKSNPPAENPNRTPIFSLDQTIVNKTKTLLEFWNSFQGYTPAQALRRWDGAHTGPLGQRHGLQQILLAAEDNSIPLVLLDLNQPQNLSVLDELGVLPTLQKMQEQGLVLLPDVATGDALESIHTQLAEEANQAFGFSSSPFSFGFKDPSLTLKKQIVFSDSAVRDHISIWQGTRVIPLPGSFSPVSPFQNSSISAKQVDKNGPTLEIKRMLLDAALRNDPAEMVVLGGDLSAQAWADSTIAPIAFAYLANHPWIQMLTAADLQTIPAEPYPAYAQPPCLRVNCAQQTSAPNGVDREALVQNLSNLPDNALTRSAWRIWFNLSRPVPDPNQAELLSNYLGEIQYWIAASQWSQHPYSAAQCTQDLDGDHHNECLLADTQNFLILKPEGARLVFAAALSNSKPVQLIAPRSQLVVGMGDPSTWKLDAGLFSDGDEIPGAFADNPSNIDAYTPTLSSNSIVFLNTQKGIQKTFGIDRGQITVQYQSSGTISTRIPVIFQPEAVFLSNWAYAHWQNLPDSSADISWGTISGPRLRITSSGAQLSLQTYRDSAFSMHLPEDPNFDYPPGHFLPYPMALINLEAAGNFTINFSIQNR